MTEHVHFNLDDFRAAHASAMDQMREQMSARTYTAAQKASHDLTFKLSDLLLEVTIACFDARNNGLPERAITFAMGTALGNTAGNYMEQMRSNDAFELAIAFYERLTDTIDRHMRHDAGAGVSGSATVHPVQGGRA